MSACNAYLSQRPFLDNGLRTRKNAAFSVLMVKDSDGYPDEAKYGLIGDQYIDPLAKPRPKFDLCAASGRPGEVCYGAVAPEGPSSLEEWLSHMRTAGEQQETLCVRKPFLHVFSAFSYVRPTQVTRSHPSLGRSPSCQTRRRVHAHPMVPHWAMKPLCKQLAFRLCCASSSPRRALAR